MADKSEKTKGVDPITFARQVRAEGNKVTWTSRAETIQASIMVIIFSIIIALFLFTADQIISYLVKIVTGINS